MALSSFLVCVVLLSGVLAQYPGYEAPKAPAYPAYPAYPAPQPQYPAPQPPKPTPQPQYPAPQPPKPAPQPQYPQPQYPQPQYPAPQPPKPAPQPQYPAPQPPKPAPQPQYPAPQPPKPAPQPQYPAPQPPKPAPQPQYPAPQPPKPQYPAPQPPKPVPQPYPQPQYPAPKPSYPAPTPYPAPQPQYPAPKPDNNDHNDRYDNNDQNDRYDNNDQNDRYDNNDQNDGNDRNDYSNDYDKENNYDATQKNCGEKGKVCQGGKCENGRCVLHELTKKDVSRITALVNAWMDGEQDNADQDGGPEADLLRAAFHDFAGPSKTMGCLLVPCAPNKCERFHPKNKGMEPSIAQALDVYWKFKLARVINLADYFNLVNIIAIHRASNGSIVIPFRWGRDVCEGLKYCPPRALPLFAEETLPDPKHNFTQISDNFEKRMNLTRQEWICLVGAHSIGTTKPVNSGYARSWSTSRKVLDNNFYKSMDDLSLIWLIEEGEDKRDRKGNQDPNVPILGNHQYFINGSKPHSGLMMLNSDFNMFWVAEPQTKCNITHDRNGCPLRFSGPIEGIPQVERNRGEFHLLNHFAANLTSWQQCFTHAYTKMIELNHPPLREVIEEIKYERK